MRRCDALLLLSLLLVKNMHGAKNPCDWRTTISNGTVLRNGSLLSLEDGNVYPEGSFWLEEKREIFYACPCLIFNCIQICKNGTLEHEIHFVDSKTSKVSIWDNNNEQSMVAIEDHFEMVHRNRRCSNPHLLTPKEDKRDRFKILSNGSLYFPPSKDAKVPRMLRPFQFCIIPTVESDENARVVICVGTERDKDDLPFITAEYIHKYTFYINGFFLALIVIVYFLSADLKNLHGRAVACYAACLLLIQIFPLYEETFLLHIIGCKANAYFIYFISEASMFWLNVICIDIYQTFKGFLSRRREVNFIYPSLYAWGGAALLTFIVLILDPTINNTYCWFSHSRRFLMYAYGPFAILLTVNLVLFCLTGRQLWLQRRETQRAFRDSTSGRVNAQDNDQFKLYLKLFLLMAFTSVNMVLFVFSSVFDLIYIRKNVCNQVMATLTFCHKKPKEILRINASMESTSKDISNVSTIIITSE